MKVKDLINILESYNQNDEVIFYNLENNDLKQFQLETILNADGRCEITTCDPKEMEELNG
jgi:hypothetical protein|tara:strand:- start:236 stop:415 length:180 start_codon:yes stop_codon:yes gene_type:complete